MKTKLAFGVTCFEESLVTSLTPMFGAGFYSPQGALCVRERAAKSGI